jgi:hypothetical protein
VGSFFGCKVKLPLDSIKHHSIKMSGEWRCNFTIPNLSASCEWVISFTPLPLYPWGNSPQCSLCRRLVGPQSQSGCYGEERNPLLLPRIRPQLLSLPASMVTIPTELACHSLFWVLCTSEKLKNKLILFLKSSIMRSNMLFVRFNGTCSCFTVWKMLLQLY